MGPTSNILLFAPILLFSVVIHEYAHARVALAQGDTVRVLASGGGKSYFEGVPTYGDLGYSANIGQMTRIIMAPRGIPADRLKKLQDALAMVNEDKTYKGLISRIGENRAFINGPDYEKIRPQQSMAYKELVKALAN